MNREILYAIGIYLFLMTHIFGIVFDEEYKDSLVYIINSLVIVLLLGMYFFSKGGA